MARKSKASTNDGIQATTISAQVIAVGQNAQATLNQVQSESSGQIADAFIKLYDAIAKLPNGQDKVIAENAVRALEEEAQKGDKAEEKAVNKWLSFLAETAPDAFEVAVATFLNPIQGLGVAFQKVAKFVSKK